MASAELIKAIAVTAELCGRVFSTEAARVFVDDLDGFEESAIAAALKRCRREVRGVLTVQDVVSRVDDGRPGPEEAWAQIPKDEAGSVVWTTEMAIAFGVAQHLLATGDHVAARMAFKERYTSLLNAARDQRQPADWVVSLGHDAHGRDQALAQAVSMRRLTLLQAREYAPMLTAHEPAPLALIGDLVERVRLPS